MTGLRKTALAVAAIALSLSTLSFADTVQKAPARKTHKKTETVQIPPYTPHQLAPLPLEQMPAVPPSVVYSSGQLTIVAHNSTLGDILRAVHSQTGADMDVPSNANERVVATLGPGPARDVLATLLNGTHFNYVLLGTPGDPTAVQRLVLTAKTGPESTATTASAAPNGPQGIAPNRFQQPVAPQAQIDQETHPEDATTDAQDDSTDTPPQDDQSADQQQGNQGQAPKTPEQLLQELQRQQQLMQQQQQGQPGATQQPGQPQVVYPNPTQLPPDQN